MDAAPVFAKDAGSERGRSPRLLNHDPLLTAHRSLLTAHHSLLPQYLSIEYSCSPFRLGKKDMFKPYLCGAILCAGLMVGEARAAYPEAVHQLLVQPVIKTAVQPEQILVVKDDDDGARRRYWRYRRYRSYRDDDHRSRRYYRRRAYWRYRHYHHRKRHRHHGDD
jgi:hypothetical protein